MGKYNPETLKISVVISFYNEANVIPELLKRLRPVMMGLKEKKECASYEIIFINDDSTDASETILREEISKYKDIILLNMSRNFGYEEGMFAGLAHAKGDAIIILPADLQDPPEVIPELVTAWKSDAEAEVVYTTRIKRPGEHPLKMLVTKIGYRFIRFISTVRIHINSGDFRLLSRKVVNHLLTLNEDKPFLRGMTSWVGFKQIPVYYNSLPRFDGAENTKNSVLSRKVLYSWLDRALIGFSDEPLKLSLICGLALSVFSLLYTFVILFQKIMGWYTPGWPAIMCAILFIGGIQLMMLGFTGLYVGAIFRQTRGRPLYIVKEIVRAD